MHTSWALPLLLSCLLALGASHALATTYSVAPSGGGDCGTIGDCVGRLQPGDTLVIHGGLYQESLTSGAFPSGTASQPITIMAAPGEQVIWTGIPGCGFPDPCRMPLQLLRNSEAYLTFDSLIFDGNNRTLANPAISGYPSIDAGPHHITFRNCEFRGADGEIAVAYASDITFEGGSVHDSGDSSGYRHGFYSGHVRNFTITGMTITNITGYGIHHWAGTDGATEPSTNVQIWNNRVIANGRSAGQCGMLIDHTQGGVIANNIVVDNGDGGSNGCGITIGYTLPSSNLHLLHNTIVQEATSGIAVFQGDGMVVENNLCYFVSNCLPSGGTVSNNVTDIDPLFVNAPGGDFGLTPNSPARGRGLYSSLVPTDMAGMPRPNPPAAGACEPGSPCTTSSGGLGRGPGPAPAAAQPRHFRLVHLP